MEIDGPHEVYWVQTNYGSLLIGLLIGWATLYLGTRRWGRGFGAVGIVLGLGILPLIQGAEHPDIWWNLVSMPDVAVAQALYWLAPAAVAVWLALLRRRRALKPTRPNPADQS